MVTVMTAWQEAVQAAASHMEGIDTTTYLVRQEDVRRVTHEYVKEVIQAHEERDAAHAEEQKKWKEAIKADDFEDPVIRLLHITRKVARAPKLKRPWTHSLPASSPLSTSTYPSMHRGL